MIRPGSPGPEFELSDTDGRALSLAQLRGAPVLLVFLPAAFTPVCSAELGALAAIHGEVSGSGASLVAVACDSMFTLRMWCEQEKVSIPMVSDFWPHGAVSRAYGAFDGERGIATRTSYVLDGGGTVRWSTRSPAGVARDFGEHLAAVRALGAS